MMSRKIRQPPQDLKSVAETKEKASQYVCSKETNKMVKQAILKELNSHLLSIKPQKIHSQNADHQRRSKSQIKQGTSLNPYQKDLRSFVKDKEAFVERHGQVTSAVASKIPRPVGYGSERQEEQKKKKMTIQKGSMGKKRIPGYDWNKNGRIAELKIRFLARKYSQIWSRNVYGRVTPSQARIHYEKKLMKKVFASFEDLWWSSRKGWKLNIRAEYHDRYRIWKSYFKAWKLYILTKKEKELKISLSVKFDEMNILRRTFGTLKDYWKYRGCVKSEKEKADQFQMRISIRSFFYLWLENLHHLRSNRSLEFQALSYWAFKLKSKVFDEWKYRKGKKDIENQKFDLAMRHCNAKLLKKYLDRLQIYIIYRRKKKYVKEFAERHFEANLKIRTIRKWSLELRHRMEIIELEDRIEFTSRKFILRAYFIRWRDYIEDVNILKNKMIIGSKHYNRRMKGKCVNAFRNAAHQRKLKDQRLQKTYEFRKKKLISRMWNCWLLRCERSEELKMYPLTKIGRAFHRKSLLQKCLCRWQRYIEWRRDRKKMFAVADKHFEQNSLPKYFAKLYEYKEVRIMKNERKIAADEFKRELMYAKYFYTWLKQSRLCQEYRMLERMAILHHEEISKRKTLGKWRHATEISLVNQNKQIIADVYLERAVKSKYFNKLKIHAVEEKTRKKLYPIIDAIKNHLQSATMEGKNFSFASTPGNCKSHDEYNPSSYIKPVVNQAVPLLPTNLTERAGRRLSNYTINERKKREKRKLAEGHHEKMLLSKVMFKLKIYINQRKEIKKEVERRSNCYSKMLKSWTFNRWHLHAVESREEKHKTKLAVNFAFYKAKREVFCKWRTFAALQIHKRRDEDLRVQEIKKILDQVGDFETIPSREVHLP